MFDRKKYNAEYYKKNRKTMRLQHKIWRALNGKEYNKRRRLSLKLRALQIISGLEVPECCSCKCKDLRALEQHHKNGGGHKELKAYNNANKSFYLEIVMGRRETDDLEVFCRVCNAKEYMSAKFGLQFEVKFLGCAGQQIN